MPKFNEDRNWTYSEGCGCRVTFFHESEFRTSRMLPGKECTAHTGRHQVAERDCLMERAKDELRFARDCADAIPAGTYFVDDLDGGRLKPKGN